MAIEIVSFPINSMVDLSIVMLNYQRVDWFICQNSLMGTCRVKSGHTPEIKNQGFLQHLPCTNPPIRHFPHRLLGPNRAGLVRYWCQDHAQLFGLGTGASRFDLRLEFWPFGVEEYGKLWKNMEKYGKLWKTPGKIWKNMENSRRCGWSCFCPWDEQSQLHQSKHRSVRTDPIHWTKQKQPQAGWTSILGRSIHLSPHVGWVNCSL